MPFLHREHQRCTHEQIHQAKQMVKTDREPLKMKFNLHVIPSAASIETFALDSIRNFTASTCIVL